MYGHHYTPQTISNMSKLVAEDVLAFKERTLEANYSVIFMDATHIPVKRLFRRKQCILRLVFVWMEPKSSWVYYCPN